MRLCKSFFVFMKFAKMLFLSSYGIAEEVQNVILQQPLAIEELPEFRVSKGEVLYLRYCSFCHGKSGAGDGLNAYSMPVKPRNFNDQNIMAQKADIELEKVILLGGASQGLSQYMPAFGKTFSNLEAKHLIKHIHKEFLGN